MHTTVEVRRVYQDSMAGVSIFWTNGKDREEFFKPWIKCDPANIQEFLHDQGYDVEESDIEIFDGIDR